jgi:phosphate butyryltransferase
MVYSNFDELIKKVQSQKILKKVAVVAAHDEHTLEAVMRAVDDNIVEPILIGREEEIRAILNKFGKEIKEENIINVEDDSQAACKAVELVRADKVDFLMKGRIQTADLLKAVVDKEKGLRTGNIMTHIAINEVPSYHKLIAITDAGMMMYPDLAKKKGIVENAVNTFLAMGYEKPKVAVLAAVERVNPKMPETVDANELKKMSLSGEIPNCIIEGPISYDITMSRESAKIKGFESPIIEDADILVVPDIAAGNILSKALIYSAGAKMAGFIVGAKVPIVLTSRGSSSEEKYLSLVLSANIDS